MCTYMAFSTSLSLDMLFDPAPALADSDLTDGLLQTVLDVSLTGVILFRPVYAATDAATIVDLAYVRLNQAAQRMLQLPIRPAASFRTLFPHSQETGVFQFYCDAFASGTVERYDVNYQHDGLDNYFHLVAQRNGALLVVSFTDTADHDRSTVELALRASQTQELAARANADAQRSELYKLFELAPVAIAVLRGPQYVVEGANPAVCALWGRTPAQALGIPLFELLPEVVGQGFEALLDGVMATGVPYLAKEMPVVLHRDGRDDTIYMNFMYQPLREADGRISGITVVATDVSEQVQDHQLVQNLNQRLDAANAALLATNAELGIQNAELRHAHRHLQRLNKTLDARVTERTEATRAALAEAERQRARLERLFMAAPAAICMLDGPELVYELVNPGYQALFPGRQLLGQRIDDALPELVGHDVIAAFRRVYETGVTNAEQGTLIPIARPADGVLEDRYFNLVQQARHDEYGRIGGVLMFAFEVTEQVVARIASEASAQQLRLVTDSLPVLIAYLDHEERFQFANQAYEAWSNQTPDELLGQTVRAVVGERTYSKIRECIGKALAGEQQDFDVEMPYRRDFMKHIHATYVPDVQKGIVVGIYTLITDVTEQVQSREQVQALNEQLALSYEDLYASNEELHAANDELGASNDELGSMNQVLVRTNVDLDTFVYTASHDLKAPITNIDGLLQALREELLPENQVGSVAHILNMMQRAIDRFQRTITQLSAIGQLQQEKGLPTPPVFLANVIRDVRLDLAPLIEAASARIEVKVQGFPSFPFSEKNLRSVVYNLLSNALKYRHPDRNPHIRLRCWLEKPYWALEVQDNGLGLDLRSDRPLFGLFQRFHTHVEGSGVGVYMVKKMIDNAHGKITVTSELGVGSVFTVYFKY